MAVAPTDPTDAPLPATPEPRSCWGARASLGWTMLAAAVLLGTQLVVTIAYAVARLAADPRLDAAALATDGRVVAAGSLVATPLVLGLVALLIAVRGWRVGPYLGLRAAPGGATLLAAAGLALGLMASDALTIRLDRPVVPPLMGEVILTAPRWLIVLALVVAAPVVEEILFRGFLYRGLAESPRIGPGVAIGLTALTWAALHLGQYDLYNLATVYLMGLYLGLVRHLTGSTSLTILLHAIANAVATAEVYYLAAAG